MTFGLLVVASVVFFILLNDQRGRIRRIEDRLDALARRDPDELTRDARPVAAPPAPPPVVPVRRPVPTSALQVPPRAQVAPLAQKAPIETAAPIPRKPARTMAANFEALAGGKLPIWIGGVALILAGFFLVRYSVEQGLLGPGARTVLAALLGVILLLGSEAARRIGRFAEDPRVGQALAGAGIASLYGTLYMASELYALIGPLTAFLLMALVTGGALFLSLRHGPPTAIMGLIGGFSAPFLTVASGSLVPLLVYLGLLIAGLFTLAIHRGWLWLALAATGGGVLWTFGIMIADLSGLGIAVGMFIIILALAATLVLPKTRKIDQRLRLLPMLGGFIQLALFAPLVNFALSGWALYGLLSAASLWLGWRNRQLMPASIAALGLVLILLSGAFLRDSGYAGAAAIGATMLFGLPGHFLARRNTTDRWWTLLALGGTAGPLLVAFLTNGSDALSSHQWGWLFAIAATACASLSWRARSEGRANGMPDWLLAGGTSVAAIMSLLAGLLWFVPLWFTTVTLIITLAIAGWARHTGDRFLRLASVLGGGLGAAFWLAALGNHMDVLGSVLGDRPAPGMQDWLALLAIPAFAAAGLAWLHRSHTADQPLRWLALGLALAAALALVPMDWHPAVLALATTASIILPDAGILPHRVHHGLLAALGLFLLVPLEPFARIIAESLIGMRLHFQHLPAVFSSAVSLAVPAVILATGLWQGRTRLTRAFRTIGGIGASVLAVAIFYEIAKQPLAIATDLQFVDRGFIERAILTQVLFGAAMLILWRVPDTLRRWALLPLGLGLFRMVWFDALLLNPLVVSQKVGGMLILNAATLHAGLASLCLWFAAPRLNFARLELPLKLASLFVLLVSILVLVRQAFHGALLDGPEIFRAEHYSYSAAFLLLSVFWLWRGIKGAAGWLRVAGLALLTLTTFKVFLVDASALEGLLRVLSFLGLGAALIGIGWGYGRFAAAATNADPESMAKAN